MTTLTDRDAGAREQKGVSGQGSRPGAGEVLTILARELRSPLGAIQNALYVLRLTRPTDPTVDRAVGVIERQAGQIARLVGDLLEFSSVLRVELVPLDTVVAYAAEACRPIVEQARHRLTVSLPPRPVRLRADPARLQQVLVHLLTNATEYTEPGGHIRLSAEVEAGELVVRVQDDGMGIAADLLPRVFDLFQQGPGLGGRARAGLGIGLALVKWLVALHGGSVTAHSGGPGRGSEFVVRLPAPTDPPTRIGSPWPPVRNGPAKGGRGSVNGLQRATRAGGAA